MGLNAGIVGLPNVGKSTLFNALTNSNILVANYPFATIEPNVGFVDIKDERLFRIAEIIKPKKVVPTSFSFTDIAGLVKGSSKGEGLGNHFLSHVRAVDAICHVVRCFPDPNISHVSGKVDPIDDIETINLELIIADLEIVEKRIPKIEKKALLKVDNESEDEYKALKKIQSFLQSGLFPKITELTAKQYQLISHYNFLTIKPVIYILNIDEKDISNSQYYINLIKEKLGDVGVVAISAQIESELIDLDEESRQQFLTELGIEKGGLDLLILEVYKLLGLATFFTTVGDEIVSAWTFKKGMKAQECAGIVHTDFASGFIKVEIVSYEDFVTYGNMQKAREAGKTRIEGKDYEFRDGDIAIFRFSI